MVHRASLPDLISTPHPLMRRNSLVNQVEFLGLVNVQNILCPNPLKNEITLHVIWSRSQTFSARACTANSNKLGGAREQSYSCALIM